MKKGIKVLIVDDEEDLRLIIEKKIRYSGYEVISAADGQEAWEKIVSERPDVVVLDLIMPKLDGYEVLKKLRENPVKGKWIPVIIVSAKGELEDIHRGLELDADHYLTKPCDFDQILRAIRLMVSLIPQRRSGKEAS